MSDGVSARPHCTLTVVVGDEHGLLKHIHVPNVFAAPPRKPDKLRAAPRELGDAGPRATLDPTLVKKNHAEFAAWKSQMAKLKPRTTRMNGVDSMVRGNGVDDLCVHPRDGTLLVGRHNGVVQRWALPRGARGAYRAPDTDGVPLMSARLQDFGLVPDMSGSGALVPAPVRRQPGPNIVGICPGPTDDTVTTCSVNGRLRVSALTANDKQTVKSLGVGNDVGCDVYRMRGFAADQRYVALGGREVGLRVIDLETGANFFKSKNVAHDWLDMRVPVWVRDLRFMSNAGVGGSTGSSGSAGGTAQISTIGVATGYGQVRLYDVRSGQRPVCDWKVSEGSERDGVHPLTCMCASEDGRSVVVGDTTGRVCAVDLRNGKVTRNFKGFTGSVRRLEFHPDHPLLVSVGIDRYLRVHDTTKGKLLHRVYLKQRLASMTLCGNETRRRSLSDQNDEDVSDTDVRSGSAAAAAAAAAAADEDDEDDVWKLLESREQESSKKRRAPVSESDNDSDERTGQSKKKAKKKAKKAKSKMTKLNNSEASGSSNHPMFPLHPSNFDVASRAQFRDELRDGQPYGCAVISPLCDPAHMVEVHSEVKNNLRATFKETDLFKLYQTDSDLATMETSDPATAAKMPKVLELRDALYSDEFRAFVAEITGVTDLTSRVDCSINAYGRGCHLMCHDDVIGTRRVSYIIYFAEPEPEWRAADGGQLELYPLDAAHLSRKNKKKKSKKKKKNMKDREDSRHRGSSSSIGHEQGIPAVAPTRTLLPAFNTMAMFVVRPGQSYHAVQEVQTDRAPRLSIQGWFHGPTPLEGSEQASLSQIMSKDSASAVPMVALHDIPRISPSLTVEEKDILFLKKWVNELYLSVDIQQKIKSEFVEKSSIQLGKFLTKSLADRITALTREHDHAFLSARAQRDFSLPSYGESGCGAGWTVRGPPHKQRYVQMNSSLRSLTSSNLSSATSSSASPSELTLLLDALRCQLMTSAPFGRLLKRISAIVTKSAAVECRRFRPGMDYTLAHYGMLTRETRLDATLCFVDDRTDDLSDQLWESGDVGGFQCYIVADEEEGTEAAEVYKSKSEEEEDELLSIPPASNTLSLVLRDGGIMQFVKYVSAAAPGSRWDVASVYEIEEQDDSSSSGSSSSSSNSGSSSSGSGSDEE